MLKIKAIYLKLFRVMNSMSLIKIGEKSGIPLVGLIFIGVIDRGTSLLQVRPTTICNQNCPFCSVNANNAKIHPNNFQVELKYLLKWIKEIVEFKEGEVEINFDSVGEVATYPSLIPLIENCAKIKGVKRLSMQTNGSLLTKEKIDKLEKAGLNQINLSINSLDKDLAVKLAGIKAYNIKKITELIEYISNSKIDLLLAPVWMPKINDEEIPKIIELAKKLNATLGIQKYEVYKYSRKIKGGKAINWWKFYRQIEQWEKEFDVKLKLSAKEMGIEKRKRLPTVFEKNEKTIVEIKCPGWINGQMIGVSKNRCISVNHCDAKEGDKVKIKILENKNNIYLAERI